MVFGFSFIKIAVTDFREFLTAEIISLIIIITIMYIILSK